MLQVMIDCLTEKRSLPPYSPSPVSPVTFSFCVLKRVPYELKLSAKIQNKIYSTLLKPPHFHVTREKKMQIEHIIISLRYN